MTKESKTVKAVPVITQGQLFKTDAEIAKAILAAEKKGMSLQKDYQRIAASALVHLAKHKDIRIVRRMIEQLPEGLRKNSMLAYLERFGQVRVLTDENAKQFKGEKGDIVFDATRKLSLAGALETPWWKAMKEPEYRPLNLDEMIANVIRLAEKRVKQGADESKGDKIDTKKLEQLRKLVA